jgi:hypothetical protein
MLRNFNKLAIPKSFVASESYVFTTHYSKNLDCHTLLRNSLGRYLELLKEKHFLMFPGCDLPATGEYPYVSNYDATPFTDRVFGVTTNELEIPDGVYQFSTNPWLPLWEYVKEYDCMPVVLKRSVADKPHLPIWFMNKQYRDSREVSLAYINMDMGEQFVDDLIDILREGVEAKEEISPKKGFIPSICTFCQDGILPWTEQDDVCTMWEPSCTLCIAQDTLWRARKRSTNAMKIGDRQEASAEIPVIKSRIRYLISTYFPSMTELLPKLLQEGDSSQDFLYAAISDEEEGGLLDMFG